MLFLAGTRELSSTPSSMPRRAHPPPQRTMPDLPPTSCAVQVVLYQYSLAECFYYSGMVSAGAILPTPTINI